MKKMSSMMKKGLSVLLAAALVCGSTGILTYTKSSREGEASEEAQLQANSLNKVKEENPAELSEKDKEELSKDETVYVIANADGSTQKLIVSDWLKNALGSDKIQDTTELTDVSNVKGEESFTKEDGNVGVWDAQGNDIYYQGSIEKELPIELKVTYQLNGKEIAPEELAGQSGKVTIRFDYTNRQKETVQVGDKKQELYVPFAVITGLVVDNDKFQNIEVSNGKIINDGERSIVMGYAMPGLKDNLDIGSEDFDIDEIDIPDYVEMTADVTDFELAATMTVATNDVFSDMDVDVQDKMDDISADMDELSDAMDELMDGTSELYDGVLELYDGTDELTDGINELNDGVRELRDGASELYDGTKTLYDGAGALKSGAGQLLAGMQKVADGLAQLNGKSPELTKGADQLLQGVLLSLNGKIQQANAALAPMGVQLVELDSKNYAAQIQGDIQILEQVIGTLETQAKAVQGMIQAAAQNPGVQPQPGTDTETTAGEAGAPETAEPAEDTAGNTSEGEDAGKESPAGDQQTGQESAGEGAVQNISEEKEEQAVTENQSAQTEPEEVSAGTQASGPVSAEPEQNVPEAEAAPAASQEEPEAQVEPKEVPTVQTAGGVQADPMQLMQQLLQLQQSIAQLTALKETLQSMSTMLGGIDSLSQGITAYTQGVASLNAGVQEIMKNAPALNSGVDSLVSGAGKLKDGAGELKNGTVELKGGTGELKDGGQELKDGVEELRDGSLELKDGVIELNDEGIQKLIDTFDGDLQELADRFDGTKAAAQAYKSFAGISDGMEGSVKFIYKTAAIEK